MKFNMENSKSNSRRVVLKALPVAIVAAMGGAGFFLKNKRKDTIIESTDINFYPKLKNLTENEVNKNIRTMRVPDQIYLAPCLAPNMKSNS